MNRHDGCPGEAPIGSGINGRAMVVRLARLRGRFLALNETLSLIVSERSKSHAHRTGEVRCASRDK